MVWPQSVDCLLGSGDVCTLQTQHKLFIHATTAETWTLDKYWTNCWTRLLPTLAFLQYKHPVSDHTSLYYFLFWLCRVLVWDVNCKHLKVYSVWNVVWTNRPCFRTLVVSPDVEFCMRCSFLHDCGVWWLKDKNCLQHWQEQSEMKNVFIIEANLGLLSHLFNFTSKNIIIHKFFFFRIQ